MMISKENKKTGFVFMMLFAIIAVLSSSTEAWEWSDLTGAGTAFETRGDYLSYQEVSDLRVRDIKRRLARNHGFSPEELARMLDKKELIRALAYEEDKVRDKAEAEMKRVLFKQSVIIAVISVLVVMCWPLLRHAWEVAHVNFVVYTDRKKLEAHLVGKLLGGR